MDLPVPQHEYDQTCDNTSDLSAMPDLRTLFGIAAFDIVRVSDDHSWLDYSKETLPRGFSYVVGRDQIEAVSNESNAAPGWLSLCRPWPPTQVSRRGEAQTRRLS